MTPGTSVECLSCGYVVTLSVPETLSLNQPQPPPLDGPGAHSVDLLIEALRQRKLYGVAKYGVAHQWRNGRSHLTDALQEAMDLSVYLVAEVEKEKAIVRLALQFADRIDATTASVSDEFMLFSKGEVRQLINLIIGRP